MTPDQLKALAEYRKHKGCQCVSCQTARRALAEMDAKGCWRKLATGNNCEGQMSVEVGDGQVW